MRKGFNSKVIGGSVDAFKSGCTGQIARSKRLANSWHDNGQTIILYARWRGTLYQSRGDIDPTGQVYRPNILGGREVPVAW